jgi:hypothetical protein
MRPAHAAATVMSPFRDQSLSSLLTLLATMHALPRVQDMFEQHACNPAGRLTRNAHSGDLAGLVG